MSNCNVTAGDVGELLEKAIVRYLAPYDPDQPLSAENSPDTTEGILRLGRFNMRVLADRLGVTAVESSYSYFMQMRSRDQAAALLAAKLRYIRDR